MAKKSIQTPYYRSLTRRIVAVLIIVSITPLILISGFLLTQFQCSYQKKIYAHLGELVLKHKQNIDSFLSEKLSDIRFLASTNSFESFRNEEFLKNRLTTFQRDYGTVYEDLGVVDENGRQLSYAGPFELENADYSEADWFKQAMHNHFYISDVFMGLRGKPHFIISVRNQWQGKYWILRSTIDFLSFNSLVENLRIGRTGFAFILNKEGQFQTKPFFNTPESVNRSIYNTVKNGKKYPSGIHIVEQRDADSGRENIVVGGFMKSGDWLMVYQQDKEDALLDWMKAQRIALLSVVFAALCIIISALLLSKGIVSRFAQLDREKEIMNKQVIESGKLASIGELASGIAHEINNPVAIMIEEAGWIEDLLEDEELKQTENLEEFKRALTQIHNQGIRCKDITHKLLSFARKSDSEIQQIQLNELVEEVVALSEQKASYENVTINTQLASHIPVIHVSSTEIQQILLNMINNALFAIDKKGRRNGIIDIRTGLNGTSVLIEITDNGCGIPRSNLSRIFDPFFTTKPVGKGSGLGLSICYGIIQNMGGNIEVQSKVDEGTTFSIFLPIKEEPPTEVSDAA